MGAVYKCLTCGLTLGEEQVGEASNVVKCRKCGRDMYRTEEGPQPGQGQILMKHGAGMAVTPAVPSRYGSSAQGVPFEQEDPDSERNPMIIPHTPFVVILGFILAFMFPPAGIIISIMGLRLVNQSEEGVRGRGLAIAGIVVGSGILLLAIIMNAAGCGAG